MSETCCVVLAKPFFKQVKDAVAAARKALYDYEVRRRKKYDDLEEAERRVREKWTWWERVSSYLWSPFAPEAHDDPQVSCYPTYFVRARSRLDDMETLAPTLLAFPTEAHHVRIPHTLYSKAVELGLVKGACNEEDSAG